MRSASRLTVLALVVGAAPVAADDATGPLPRATLDRRVHELLVDVINTGSDLYNGDKARGVAPNQAGCYHLYQGSLLTLRPLLDHRPDLQKAIAASLDRAAREADVGERAFVLRRTIDKIRAGTEPKAVAATLWERLGGEDNVKRVIDDFVAAAAGDAKVNFFRNGKFKDKVNVQDLKRLLVEQVSAVSGGPHKYTGRDMKTVHEGMGITNAEFDALAGHLEAALKKNGAAEDDVKAVLGVVGGTRKDIVEMTLWERLGGEEAVGKVVDDFIQLAAPDPKVNFDRGGKFKVNVADLRKQLIAFVSAATGGPIAYTGRSMKDAHKGMGITDDEFNALSGHLQTALRKNGVKNADVDAVLRAVEGTRKDMVEKK